MSFFDLFQRSKSDERKHTVRQYSEMPTVEAPQQLFIAFDKVFFEVMSAVEGLHSHEKVEVHKLIVGCEGGHLNRSGYFNFVYEKYFKDRNWTWREFNKWQSIFDALGDYPSRWPKKKFELNELNILRSLRISDIRTILHLEGVELPSDAKKDALIDSILLNEDLMGVVLNSRQGALARQKLLWGMNKEIFGLLMRTITGRAYSESNLQRQIDHGIHRELKQNLVVGGVDEKKFIDLALLENPNALPPFFPGDVSTYVYRMEIDDDLKA